MGNTRISNHSAAYGLSLAFSSVINAVLVIAQEKNPAIMATMGRLTAHHWVTHSMMVILLFVVLGWFLSRANGGRGVSITANRLIGTLVSAVALSGMVIAGFYWIEC